ncbi:MAG: MGMT family protein [bacterium]
MVYNIVLSIPEGETRTYQWVAEKIGNPKSARAVGNALSKNPCPITIPCHRIIRKDGRVGGYIKGKEEKRLLLEKEGAPVAQYGRAAVS